ncbi:SGNH/GDSL hydrolase family protein [Pedobacter metabolipauper]|uniref:GDSL-like lipase/acylhydrolase family protein n=1 Tax=Pedobacter metabolipauper TaxID=425513 RepID=A0A4R6SYZ6_9SPHI|nr:SGNH/GDSL hydrolase family protein [Pedobacter metabolipauper]TDQ11844.1 GDSL-like lipase/acylhydrolase family protein [Pedobacter metabolipauper]
MKRRIFFLLTIMVCSIQISCVHANENYTDTLSASKLKPYGRYLFNAQNNLELISSASHFGFKFKGSQCALYVSVKNENDHNYIQYELDGVYQKRIRINGHPNEPIIINIAGNVENVESVENVEKVEHTIRIYKATEAHTGAVVISKVAADHVKSISVSKTPLIEFIGNSITCGAASDPSDVPCGTGDYHDQHNAYMAYGPRVARDLGMNYILSSVSGIGIYRTWNMDGPSMPQVYENIDFQLNNAHKWDFKTYSPEIVSIALGTNDLSNGDGKTPRKPFDEKIFVNNYVNFVKLVKSKYPKAQIALLSSPMVKGASGSTLENCLKSVKTQIDSLYPSAKPVKTFFFPPMEANGCSGHPSVEDHLMLANQLKPFYQGLLK